MRGISMSSVMTSGTSCRIFSAAANGSAAVAITSMSGSDDSSADSVWRTTAESSTISTRTFLFTLDLPAARAHPAACGRRWAPAAPAAAPGR